MTFIADVIKIRNIFTCVYYSVYFYLHVSCHTVIFLRKFDAKNTTDKPSGVNKKCQN